MITIIVDGNTFQLKDESHVNVNGYDLEITEPGFDKKTSKNKLGRFIDKPISMPMWILMKVNMTSLNPCSGLKEDANGNLQFSAYFD